MISCIRLYGYQNGNLRKCCQNNAPLNLTCLIVKTCPSQRALNFTLLHGIFLLCKKVVNVVLVVTICLTSSIKKYCEINRQVRLLSLGQALNGLGTHLFVKVPRPGNSELTFSVFESSCYLLLPV